ncbi:DUF1294 domain-containing protein [Rhizobium sp. CECT 9324]|jgi:uncharacterized membrane protein YsdA (DUF1294 family)|uniref:DUF1294 domain-containing protein n=1 Tax=Rhizobium sp. CECT 9324 TaxID=2845820 RepID=UPI001E40F0C9|nr:DUF1294 domain-containing protein [Rhizobium sp. CECT 9324]CAH0340385.1 hypothetical protein RHI9324_02049 [Rhizobium sp. CECT 9324]
MASETILTVAALAALYNVFVFGIYAFDKLAARKGSWRVRESTLIFLAVLGGGTGAFFCQRLLRHKTRKPPFRLLLPILFVLQSTTGLILLLVPDQVFAAAGYLGALTPLH